jgi:hypothetical protein
VFLPLTTTGVELGRPYRVHLPLVNEVPPYIPNEGNPRVGFAAVGHSPSVYPDIRQLNAGAYLDYSMTRKPARPGGMAFMQEILMHQNTVCNRLIRDRTACPYVVPYDYTINTTVAEIVNTARANPGTVWLLGNEIDRRDEGRDSNWGPKGKYGPVPESGKNEMMPELYARAYHDLYTVIKQADPTAKVAIGSVVEPTPLRIAYLDRIWAEYKRQYGTEMPVDVFNTHVFITKEDCNDYGADVPAGYDGCYGVTWRTDPRFTTDTHHINPQIFEEYVRAYRQWMKRIGQQDKPLLISELGVYYKYDWAPYTGTYDKPEVVRDWMLWTSDFLLNTKDDDVGMPADDGRLVQSWIWYSLDDNSGAGNIWASLFDADMKLTVAGDTFGQWSRSHVVPLPKGVLW